MTVPTLKPHSVILFQGNSITDAGRVRTSVGPNSPDGMGAGYPRLIMDRLLKDLPDRSFQFYNRGVSGDRIQDLYRRWEGDSLRLLPDLISILIGVNDTWNYLYLGMGASPEQFLDLYRELLENTRQRLPDLQLVLCEPFVLLTGEVTEEWEDDLARRQAAVLDLAGDYGAIHVPFQAALNAAVSAGVPRHLLLDDGVHPTARGHQLLADSWLEAVLD